MYKAIRSQPSQRWQLSCAKSWFPRSRLDMVQSGRSRRSRRREGSGKRPTWTRCSTRHSRNDIESRRRLTAPALSAARRARRAMRSSWFHLQLIEWTQTLPVRLLQGVQASTTSRRRTGRTRVLRTSCCDRSSRTTLSASLFKSLVLVLFSDFLYLLLFLFLFLSPNLKISKYN